MIKDGRFPDRYEFLPTGRNVVLEDSKDARTIKCVIYAQVSSVDQKPQMLTHAERIGVYHQSLGIRADDGVFEIGNGFNGKRAKLKAILHDKSTTHIAVEHRSRLARFGFQYIQAALEADGRTILIADNAEVEEEVVRDLHEVIVSMCARLYSNRPRGIKRQRLWR